MQLNAEANALPVSEEEHGHGLHENEIGSMKYIIHFK